MGCTCSNGSDAYLACAGIQPIYTEEQVALYAQRVGATGGSGNWIGCYSTACLRLLRLIYWKQSYGDCGQTVGVRPNTAQILGGQLKAVAVADPEPISKAVVGILGTIAGLFGAGHAKAVAKEQTVLCSAMQQYNAFADAMEQAIAAKAIALPDAINNLQTVRTQIRSVMSQVAKPTNFGFGMQLALDALVVFNKEVIYPALVPSGLASFTNPATASGKAFLVGAGIVGAKVIGVF